MRANLYSTNGAVVYSEELGPKFNLNKFIYNSKAKDIDINKTIEELNKVDGINIKRVAFVDDNKPWLKSMISIGVLLGHYIEGYDSPTKAKEAICSNVDNYDLLLIDHKMPKISGSELATNIKSLKKDVSLCILTGDPSEVNVAPELNVTIQTKPYRIDKILPKAVRL